MDVDVNSKARISDNIVDVNRNVMELFSRRRLWNDTVFVLLILFGFVINTTAYHLGRYGLHLLLLKSSIAMLTECIFVAI